MSNVDNWKWMCVDILLDERISVLSPAKMVKYEVCNKVYPCKSLQRDGFFGKVILVDYTHFSPPGPYSLILTLHPWVRSERKLVFRPFWGQLPSLTWALGPPSLSSLLGPCIFHYFYYLRIFSISPYFHLSTSFFPSTYKTAQMPWYLFKKISFPWCGFFFTPSLSCCGSFSHKSLSVSQLYLLYPLWSGSHFTDLLQPWVHDSLFIALKSTTFWNWKFFKKLIWQQNLTRTDLFTYV